MNISKTALLAERDRVIHVMDTWATYCVQFHLPTQAAFYARQSARLHQASLPELLAQFHYPLPQGQPCPNCQGEGVRCEWIEINDRATALGEPVECTRCGGWGVLNE